MGNQIGEGQGAAGNQIGEGQGAAPKTPCGRLETNGFFGGMALEAMWGVKTEATKRHIFLLDYRDVSHYDQP